MLMNAYAMRRLTFLFMILLITFLLVVPFASGQGFGSQAFVAITLGALMFVSFAGLLVRNLDKFVDLKNIQGLKTDWKDRFRLFVLAMLAIGAVFTIIGFIVLIVTTPASANKLIGMAVSLLSLAFWAVLMYFVNTGRKVDIITYWSPYGVYVMGIIMAL